MKQHNFNFGDMVQHPEFGRGVVVAAFDHSVDVIFENNRTLTRTICFAFLDELELIPPPETDTARLEWLYMHISKVSKEQAIGKPLPKDFFQLRQAIDKAMQEQTP